MGRPAGSKNKPKDGQQPAGKKTKAASPGAGHNSDLSDDEIASLLLQGLETIEGLTKDKDSLVAKIRNQRQKLQAIGFKAPQINFALLLRKQDTKESQEEWEANKRIARLMNHPIGTVDLFDAADADALIKKAFAYGKTAGLAGKACDPLPNFDPASDEGQSWINGWHDGQKGYLAAAGRGNTTTLIKGNQAPKPDEPFGDALDEKTVGAPAAEAKPDGAAAAEGEDVNVESVPAARKPYKSGAAGGDAFLERRRAEMAEEAAAGKDGKKETTPAA